MSFPAHLLIPLLASLAPTSSPASSPGFAGDDELPEADALLARHREAVGAERRNDGGTLTAHGKCWWDGMDGAGFVTEVHDGLRRARSRTEFEPFGVVEFGFGDGVVWERSPLEIKVREGWDASQFVRIWGVAQHLPWSQLYERWRTVAGEDVDGRACWVVNLHPRPLVPLDEESERTVPPPDVAWLDAETGLLRRLEAKAVGFLDEPTVMRVDYTDWRAVDGVLYAHRQDVTISGFVMHLEFHSFEHDLELPEGFFELDDDVAEALRAHQSGETEAAHAEIRVETLEETHLASIRLTTPHDHMQRTLAVLLPEVLRHVMASGTPMAGQPLVRYHNWGDPLDIEAAIPVQSAVEAKGRVKPATLPAGEAVIAWHVGPYDRLGETYERVMAYMEEHGLERRAAPWEEYWTDPGMEPDPSKWRTRVVWPVQPRSGG